MSKITEEDLSLLPLDALDAHGYGRQPKAPEAASERFEADDTVCDWFPADFAAAYVAHKRGELA